MVYRNDRIMILCSIQTTTIEWNFRKYFTLTRHIFKVKLIFRPTQKLLLKDNNRYLIILRYSQEHYYKRTPNTLLRAL